MLVPISILSFIFILIAFLVTEKNAKYVLSGYNSMSEEERQNFDIQTYMPFFKKFHIFLGITLFIVSTFLYYFISDDWCGFFLGVYPILSYIYFVWKGSSFSKIKTRKQTFITYIAMILLF